VPVQGYALPFTFTIVDIKQNTQYSPWQNAVVLKATDDGMYLYLWARNSQLLMLKKTFLN
jgi:hypothetical protein